MYSGKFLGAMSAKIEDVLHLRFWNACDDTAQSINDSCVIGERCDTLAIHARNCFVVGLDGCLECPAVHRRGCHEGLVDSLQSLLWVSRELGVQIRVPRN